MFNIFKKNQTSATNIWVPAGDKFVPYFGKPITKSIDGISNELGYQSEQVYSYRDFQNDSSFIDMIAFEFYTRKILFVFTNKPMSKLKFSDVINYAQGYVLSEIYDATELQYAFDEAIKNRSFSSDFLSNKFGVKFEDNGIQIVPEINYLLFFNDGFLSDYQRSDGLNEAANYFKTHAPSRYNLIESHAKKYWGSDLISIQEEINTQCDALFRMPEVIDNPFISLHEMIDGWVNYFMLLVTHYSEPINIEKFLIVNHGRYKKDAVQINTYTIGKFSYEFDEKGNLVNVTNSL